MNKKPTHLIVRKVLWAIMLITGLVTLFLAIIWANEKDCADLLFTIGIVLTVFSIPLILWAFEIELHRMRNARELYKKQQNQAIVEEFYSVDADTKHRLIKKTASSMKQGLSNENCSKCGNKVDSDENFCNNCGAPIYKKCNKCNKVNKADDKFCGNCGNKLDDK